MASDLPLGEIAGGVRVAVRLTPRAAADRITGIGRDAENRPVLCVSVRAPPAEGRANAALLRLLASEWRIARRDLSIVAGYKSRDKLVGVAGEPGTTLAQLTATLTGAAG